MIMEQFIGPVYRRFEQIAIAFGQGKSALPSEPFKETHVLSSYLCRLPYSPN